MLARSQLSGKENLPTITNTGFEVTTGCLVGSILMTPSFNHFWI